MLVLKSSHPARSGLDLKINVEKGKRREGWVFTSGSTSAVAAFLCSTDLTLHLMTCQLRIDCSDEMNGECQTSQETGAIHGSKASL